MADDIDDSEDIDEKPDFIVCSEGGGPTGEIDWSRYDSEIMMLRAALLRASKIDGVIRSDDAARFDLFVVKDFWTTLDIAQLVDVVERLVDKCEGGGTP